MFRDIVSADKVLVTTLWIFLELQEIGEMADVQFLATDL